MPDDASPPFPRARVAPGTAYTSPNDVLSADLTPRFSSTYRVTVAVSAAVAFTLRVAGEDLPFNQGAALGIDQINSFEFGAEPEDAFNFRFGANCTIRYFQVQEFTGR